MLSKYTTFGAGSHADTLSTLLKVNLSRQLSRLVPVLKEELECIAADEFPSGDGQSRTKLFSLTDSCD
jgi:hypothetical protein